MLACFIMLFKWPHTSRDLLLTYNFLGAIKQELIIKLEIPYLYLEMRQILRKVWRQNRIIIIISLKQSIAGHRPPQSHAV